MSGDYAPKGYFIATKSAWIALFEFQGLDGMRDLAKWMKDNGWAEAGKLPTKGEERQPDGFVPECPDHKADMKPSQHKQGSYYCDIKTGGQKCRQRYNEKGYFKAKG